MPSLLLCIVLLVSLGTAFAGTPDQTTPETLKRLSLEELSQIEVTSPSKEPQPAFRIPMAIYVITAEDIRHSGMTTIPDVLRLAPGVEVAQIEGSKWSVGIRGFGSRLARSVLVLIDGRTVYTTFFAGTYWEVQDTILEDIERIEVIRGPGGTIWGPNAVNGVINIITKHSKDTQGMMATAIGGTYVQATQFRYGGGNGRNLTYRVYGKAFTRGPQFHQDARNYDDWRGGQVGFRLDWTRNEQDKVTVQGDLYGQEAGQRVPLVNYTPPFKTIAEQNADLSGGNVTARWSRTLRSGTDIQVQTYYDRTNRYEANFGEARDTVDLDFMVRNRVGARNQISWGAGARSSHGAATQMITGLTFDPLTRTDYLLTGFLQDEIGIVEDRVSLTLGTKLLRTNFTKFEVEPSARLLWTPTSRQAAWVSFTHALRTPSRAERDFYLSGYIGTAANGLPFFGRFNPNDQFAPEQLNGYEGGFRFLLSSNLYFDVAGFHNRYHDLFSQELAGPTFIENQPGSQHVLIPLQFRNGLGGTTSGMEIVPEWRPKAWWRLKGSYSYLTMDLHATPGTTELGTAPITEKSSPRHEGVVQSAIDLAKGFDFDLTFRTVSSLPGQGIPGYSTGDARLGWRINRSLELSLVGSNLLQPWHLEFGNDPGPAVGIRRSAYLKLVWTR